MSNPIINPSFMNGQNLKIISKVLLAVIVFFATTLTTLQVNADTSKSKGVKSYVSNVYKKAKSNAKGNYRNVKRNAKKIYRKAKSNARGNYKNLKRNTSRTYKKSKKVAKKVFKTAKKVRKVTTPTSLYFGNPTKVGDPPKPWPKH